MGGQGSKTEDEKQKRGGEPITHDPNFNGPNPDRGCTDVICCFIFVVFVLAYFLVGLYAFAMGDPRTIIYPTDSDGKLCGVGSNLNKPYLMYFDLLKCAFTVAAGVQICSTPQVCVAQCPKIFWSPVDDYKEAYCRPGHQPTSSQVLLENILAGDCAPYLIPSSPIVFRCMPDMSKLLQSGSNTFAIDIFNTTLNTTRLQEGTNVLGELIKAQGYGIKILADVTSSWWIILLFVGLAAVISLIWIILMRWISGVVVWISILLYLGFFAFAVYYSFNKYVQLRNTKNVFILTTNFEYYANLKETWLALGIITAIILGVSILVFLFLVKRIRIAIALIKEASRAISNMMSTLLWPIVPFVFQMLMLAYWGAAALCLASISRTESCNATSNGTESAYTGMRCDVQKLFEKIPCVTQKVNGSNSINEVLCKDLKYGNRVDDRYTIVLQFFMLFMWFWLLNFFVALGQVTLAGAFASYYWAFNKPADIPALPLLKSFLRTLRYHLGSLAFGSLLIAIVQLIVAVLEYLDHRLKGKQFIVAKIILKCCICCFWCLEKCLKFFTKNAYIMIAIHGTNFCKSAFHAFNLILRNIIRVFVVDKMTDFLLFISKLFIVGSVGVFAYFFFAQDIPGVDNVIPKLQLNYYLIPVIIIIISTFIIASVFFGVYDMAVDTLFLCFLEDLERNDGSPERPYFMNKSLMDLLGKTNKHGNIS